MAAVWLEGLAESGAVAVAMMVVGEREEADMAKEVVVEAVA